MLPPVQFDHAAAAAAAEACRETARVLRQTLTVRADQSSHALRFWTGPHADLFTDIAGALDTEGDALVEDLERTASRIEQAAEDAAAEQRRRDIANAEEQRLRDLAEAGAGPR